MRNLTNVPQDTVILTKQTGKFSEMERQIENKHGDRRIYRPSFLKPRERSKTTHRAHETVNHLVQRISEVHFVIPMHMDMFRGKYALTTNKVISLLMAKVGRDISRTSCSLSCFNWIQNWNIRVFFVKVWFMILSTFRTGKRRYQEIETIACIPLWQDGN